MHGIYSIKSKSTFQKSYLNESKKVTTEKVTQVIVVKSNFRENAFSLQC